MKVGFATADWSISVVEDTGTPSMGGSGWIRLGQYSQFLTIDHVLGTLVYSNDSETFGVTDVHGEHHLDCDIIYMQRWMLSDIPENIRKARAQGQIIVNDLDDWYWGLHDKHFAKNIVDMKTNKKENIFYYRDALRASDLVVVSTEFLAEKMRSRFDIKNVVIHENCVDFKIFKPRVHNEGPIVIGWHGSTAHRSGDLDVMRDVFPRLDEASFSFHHTGYSSTMPAFWDEVGVPQERVTIFPMVSPTKIPKVLHFDVGIAPLNDIPFNHAKSWIKPLEYIAAGIPFIASKSPEYGRLRQEFGVGRFASKPADWIGHIKSLSKLETRQSEAISNLKAVRSLDVRVGALRLEKILESIA